jgi:hypothetical protein
MQDIITHQVIPHLTLVDTYYWLRRKDQEEIWECKQKLSQSSEFWASLLEKRFPGLKGSPAFHQGIIELISAIGTTRDNVVKLGVNGLDLPQNLPDKLSEITCHFQDRRDLDLWIALLKNNTYLVSTLSYTQDGLLSPSRPIIYSADDCVALLSLIYLHSGEEPAWDVDSFQDRSDKVYDLVH